MTLPAWWSEKADKKKQNRRSARQERDHAERTGGRVQAGSGSSWRAPQDVVGRLDDKEEGYLDECKYTDAGSFSIQRSYWQRLRNNAHRAGREPRLFIEFHDKSGRITRLVVTEDDSG